MHDERTRARTRCMHPAQWRPLTRWETGRRQAHCDSDPPRPQRAAGGVRDRPGSRHSARRVGPWRRRNHRPPGSPSPNRRAGRGGERPPLAGALPPPRRRWLGTKPPTYGLRGVRAPRGLHGVVFGNLSVWSSRGLRPTHLLLQFLMKPGDLSFSVLARTGLHRSQANVQSSTFPSM